ncbi:MAG: sugar transferase [Terriglobia bacterium]
MKSLHFRDRAATSSSRGVSSWFAGSANDHDGWFLREDELTRALALECKRVERSHKLLLLVLLDARKLFEGPEGQKALSAILSMLSSSTRETDLRGWYQKGLVIGIIFTEITEGEKGLIGNAVQSRLTEHLRSRLGAEKVQSINFSLSFFPEEWHLGNAGSDGNGERYANLFRGEDTRKGDRALKRMIDVAGSGAALLALSPLFLLLASLVKLTSKGPAFFRQKRVGKYGRPFECLKFRSMHTANDPNIHKEYIRKLISGTATSPPQPGPVYKMKNDPRITRAGRLLRKTSLDELPQLWNVLRGEMSLVGPRPAIPYELECYDRWHRRRVLEVKPGITGLWQVHGRSRTTFDEMVRLDLRYARSWSIWLDIKILLKTPKAVVSGEGAY